jgi:nitrite reductase/ring-hydroxylating ferredoxin subunit
MTRLCSLKDVVTGSGKEVMIEDAAGRRYVALFRAGEGVVAYLNTCPHQGRSLNWAPDQFLLDDKGRLVCPHHGACFDLSSGQCITGPCAGASLTSLEIEITDGVIYLSE